MARVLIGELLVSANVLKREQLEEALAVAREPGKKLGQLLLERGLVTEAQLTQTLSLQMSVPWVSLLHIEFSRQLLNRVPRDVAEKFCLIPIFVRQVKGAGETLYVAMDDPTNQTALAEVSRCAALPARPMIASPSDIRSAIRVYYGDAGEAAAPSAAAEPPTTRPEPPPVPMTTREGRGVRPAPPQVPAAAVAAKAPVEEHAEPAAPLPTATRRSEGGSTTPGKTPRMVALTLLDGTALQLPARNEGRRASSPPSAGGAPDKLTARDLISALRAISHGADASEILGEEAQWEPILAALLSLLLKKGVIADWEFVEEYRKI